MTRFLSRPGAWLAIALGLGLRVYVGLLGVDDYRPATTDPAQYIYLGRSLATGSGYAMPWGMGTPLERPAAPTAERPPLYPMFLAAVFVLSGDGLRSIVVAQAFLDMLSCLLLALTARVLFGNGAAMVTLWWAVLDPGLWMHVSRIWSECLLIALASALFFVLSRDAERDRGPSLLAGALLGLLALTRPNGVFFAPVIALSVGRALPIGRRLLKVALTLCIAAAVIAPWAARNYLQFHRVIPISTGIGEVLLGAYRDATLDDPRVRGAWMLPAFPPGVRAYDEVGLDERARAEAIAWAARHWRDLPRLAWYRAVRLWTDVGWSSWEVQATRRRPNLAWIERSGYAATLAFAAFGLWRTRRAIGVAPFILSTIVSFTVCSCLTWGGWRLRAAIEPALVLLVGAGFASRPSVNRRSWRPTRPFSEPGSGLPARLGRFVARVRGR